MLLIPRDTIFIQTNMKNGLKEIKKFNAGGKNDARGDDNLMFLFKEPKQILLVKLKENWG